MLLYYIAMWFSIFTLLTICCCIYALTEEEMKADMTRLVIKCNSKGQVDISDLLPLQRYVTPTKPETKCILACAYKEYGSMTKDGLYDINFAYKTAERMKNGDEKRLVNAKKIADICVKVNDVKVSDGTKGCDRAALIFKCIAETSPKFGFKL